MFLKKDVFPPVTQRSILSHLLQDWRGVMLSAKLTKVIFSALKPSVLGVISPLTSFNSVTKSFGGFPCENPTITEFWAVTFSMVRLVLKNYMPECPLSMIRKLSNVV